MNDEKWQATIGRIKDEFEVLEEKTVELEDTPGQKEYIVFQGPMGKIKLERLTKPLFEGTRGIGSKRIGSQAKVEYLYSDTEKTHAFKAYKWNEAAGDWQTLEAGGDFKI